MRNFILVVTAVLLVACSPAKDLLLGKWQVFLVERGEDKVGGPGFRGSTFHFLEEGLLETTDPQDMVMTVSYRHEDNSLVYVMEEGEEYYRIDSLTEDRLIIFNDNDGIPTTIHLLRLKE